MDEDVRINAFEMKSLRHILYVSWIEGQKRIEQIFPCSGQTSLQKTVEDWARYKTFSSSVTEVILRNFTSNVLKSAE